MVCQNVFVINRFTAIWFGSGDALKAILVYLSYPKVCLRWVLNKSGHFVWPACRQVGWSLPHGWLFSIAKPLSTLLLKNVFFSIGSANIPALFEIPIHRSTFFLKIFISPLKIPQNKFAADSSIRIIGRYCYTHSLCLNLDLPDYGINSLISTVDRAWLVVVVVYLIMAIL